MHLQSASALLNLKIALRAHSNSNRAARVARARIPKRKCINTLCRRHRRSYRLRYAPRRPLFAYVNCLLISLPAQSREAAKLSTLLTVLQRKIAQSAHNLYLLALAFLQWNLTRRVPLPPLRIVFICLRHHCFSALLFLAIHFAWCPSFGVRIPVRANELHYLNHVCAICRAAVRFCRCLSSVHRLACCSHSAQRSEKPILEMGSERSGCVPLLLPPPVGPEPVSAAVRRLATWLSPMLGRHIVALTLAASILIVMCIKSASHRLAMTASPARRRSILSSAPMRSSS